MTTDYSNSDGASEAQDIDPNDDDSWWVLEECIGETIWSKDGRIGCYAFVDHTGSINYARCNPDGSTSDGTTFDLLNFWSLRDTILGPAMPERGNSYLAGVI